MCLGSALYYVSVAWLLGQYFHVARPLVQHYKRAHYYQIDFPVILTFFPNGDITIFIEMILHEWCCFIEFINRVGKKR